MVTALENVRVVDLTQHVTGPFATKLLADYGADVIKVERRGVGDSARQLGPFINDAPGINASGLFLHLNTNKRSVEIDLKKAEGRALLLDLLEGADILVESFSPRVMPSLGLDWKTVHDRSPRLTMVSISNFGQTGPYRDYKMSEITAYALGGTMASTGLPDREPVKLAQSVMQIYAGTVAATAILGAYLGATSADAGQHVDLSLFEIMAANQDRGLGSTAAFQYLGQTASHRLPVRRPAITPASAYPCRDGYVQFFALVQSWKAACILIEREDLIDDAYFLERQVGDPEANAKFEAIFRAWLLNHDKQEIMLRAQQVGYIAGAANKMAEVFADEHLASRAFFVDVDHPVTGPLRYPGGPVRFEKTPWRSGRAPLLGEHTDEVLRERLNLSEAALAALHDAEVI